MFGLICSKCCLQFIHFCKIIGFESLDQVLSKTHGFVNETAHQNSGLGRRFFLSGLGPSVFPYEGRVAFDLGAFQDRAEADHSFCLKKRGFGMLFLSGILFCVAFFK